MQQLAGILTEGYYDLVSQYKGFHDGNPLPGKNEFLHSLGLDEEGIETLETWVNLMVSDENWKKQTYPNGLNSTDIIRDISRLVKDLPEFVNDNKSVNPVKIANALKNRIKK